EEGVVYTDHFGDERRRDQQPEFQQEELDLNATANDVIGVNEANVDSGDVQNGRPHPPVVNPGGRRIPNAIDKIGSGDNSRNQEQHRSQTSRPFGGIGPNEFHIAQDLRHRIQSMEQEVRELRKENAEL
ncbi:hypothetical protein PIB30_072642, partial [Stylosanthes scabra]|nr:hypothetical protein [Stylosanthes scabra]